MENVNNFDKVKAKEFFSSEENVKKLMGLSNKEGVEFLQSKGISFGLEDLELFKKGILGNVENEDELMNVAGGLQHITPAYVLAAPLKFVSYCIGAVPGTIIQGVKDGYRDSRESHFSNESYIKKDFISEDKYYKR